VGLSQLDINALGEQTLTTFDAEGRPLTVELKNPNGASVRSTAYQYSADHHSVTTVQDGRAMRPQSLACAVGGGAPFAAHRYDYDASGRITTWEQDRGGGREDHHLGYDRTSSPSW